MEEEIRRYNEYMHLFHNLHLIGVSAKSIDTLAYEKKKEKFEKREQKIMDDIALSRSLLNTMKLEKVDRINEIEKNAEARKNLLKPNKDAIEEDDDEENLEQLKLNYEASIDLLESEQMNKLHWNEKTARLRQEVEVVKTSLEIIEGTNRELESQREDVESTCNELKAKVNATGNVLKRNGIFNDSETINENGAALSSAFPVEELRSNGHEPPSENGLGSLFDEVNAPHGEMEEYYYRIKQEVLKARSDKEKMKKKIQEYENKCSEKITSNLQIQKERDVITEERNRLWNEIFEHFEFVIRVIEKSLQTIESAFNEITDDVGRNQFQRASYFKDEIRKLKIVLKSTRYFGDYVKQKSMHISIDLRIAEKRLRKLIEIHEALTKQLADISVEANGDVHILQDTSCNF